MIHRKAWKDALHANRETKENTHTTTRRNIRTLFLKYFRLYFKDTLTLFEEVGRWHFGTTYATSDSTDQISTCYNENCTRYREAQHYINLKCDSILQRSEVFNIRNVVTYSQKFVKHGINSLSGRTARIQYRALTQSQIQLNMNLRSDTLTLSG